MTTIAESVREFLATGPLAHVVTLTRQGVPHVQLTWAGLEGEELVFATFYDPKRVHRVERNPAVTASFQAREYDGPALFPYLVIRGRATVSAGGALEVMDRLSPIYLGPGATYPFRDGPPGWVFRVEIDEVYGQGPWNPQWVAMDARGE